MAVLRRSLLWRRLDTTGSEHALLSDQAGLHARGTIVAADPVPYTCGYELLVDDTRATARLVVTTEGAGWLRNVKLERAAGRWHVTAGEQGDLDKALAACGHPPAGMPGMEEPSRLIEARDVDLGYSALFNSLPLRRLWMVRDKPGTAHTITVAWVLVPSLEVMPARQTYTTLGDGRIRFESGSFTADLTVDGDGYVRRYPGLAELV
jgi:uncharacterized protein